MGQYGRQVPGDPESTGTARPRAVGHRDSVPASPETPYRGGSDYRVNTMTYRVEPACYRIDTIGG